jgi:hypothetical protein
MNYQEKYLKYKSKYINLKLIGGANNLLKFKKKLLTSKNDKFINYNNLKDVLSSMKLLSDEELMQVFKKISKSTYIIFISTYKNLDKEKQEILNRYFMYRETTNI